MLFQRPEQAAAKTQRTVVVEDQLLRVVQRNAIGQKAAHKSRLQVTLVVGVGRVDHKHRQEQEQQAFLPAQAPQLAICIRYYSGQEQTQRAASGNAQQRQCANAETRQHIEGHGAQAICQNGVSQAEPGTLERIEAVE